METMKIGKNYIDFYQGDQSFYELSLDFICTDSDLEHWCHHMSRKRWFIQAQMLDGFRQSLMNWLETGDARRAAMKTGGLIEVYASIANKTAGAGLGRAE